MKKNTIFITLGIILLLIGVGAIFGLQQTQIGTMFVKPDWARLECAPTDSYEGIYYKWLDEQLIYKCDGFTEECRMKVEHTGGSWSFNLRTNWRICNLGGGGCTSWMSLFLDNGEITDNFPFINSGQQYEFITDGIDEIGYNNGKVTIDWKPWKLYRFVGGAKWIVNSYNCDITSGTKSNIRQEDSADELFRQGGEGMKWINYVNDWNHGPAINVFNHPFYGEIYCTAGQIFNIIELQMMDGTLKKVDPQYTKTLPNGDRLNGLGAKLANVECCPNEPNCGSDFKYVPIKDVEEKECFTDIQCYNAGGPTPIDLTHYILYQCIEEKCIKTTPIEVECTTNGQCPDGEICDLSTMNYGKCIKQIPKYCGDGVCDITETIKTCPADCSKDDMTCSWYQDKVTGEEVHKSWYNYIGIGEPKTTSYTRCVTSGWVYMTIGAGTVLIIVLMLAFIPKTGVKKK